LQLGPNEFEAAHLPESIWPLARNVLDCLYVEILGIQSGTERPTKCPSM